jgi:putative ABC transport system substrate-binding protein
MSHRLKRRDVIAGLGAAAGSAIFWPPTARAQPAHPLIGFLSGSSAKPSEIFVASIHRGLKEAGFVDGQNLRVEYRWAEARYDRLPALAKELVDLKVRAIVTFGSNEAGLAAKAATRTIPVVFSAAEDPIASGLVTSLSRPEGNLTGVTWMGADLLAKGVELMHELLPHVVEFGLLLNAGRRNAASQVGAAEEAAARVGKKIRALNAASPREIDEAFAIVAKERIGALIVATEPQFTAERERIVGLASRHAVPTAYFLREFVAAGGLLSYGSSLQIAYVLLGAYTGRILNGAGPADLPIQRNTKVELVINLKTAKALGLTIPLTLLGRADEVIE